ncbi:MAG: hypothetical protein EXR49_02475 [Dehalococcoidia bacterium]|nr:hypothetical protein [Dehalococcoidia bacterium]
MASNVSFRYAAHTCRDLEKTLTFYQEVLGFDFMERRVSSRKDTAKLLGMPWPMELQIAWLRRDHYVCEFYDFATQGTQGRCTWVPNRAGLQFVSLDIKDLPGLLAKTPRYGGKVLEDTNLGQSCCVLDPDGQVLELVDMRTTQGAKGPRDPDKRPPIDPAWPASRFRHLAHVAHDLPRTRRFYEELLGFTFMLQRESSWPATAKLLRMPWPMRLELAFLLKDGMELELMHYPTHPTKPAREWVTNRPGLCSMRLTVGDLRGLLKEVPEYGGRVIPETDIGAACMIYDCDGQTVELVQRAPAATGRRPSQ